MLRAGRHITHCISSSQWSRAASSSQRVIGIRREDHNPWERRAPFSPQQVAQLVRSGAKVIVQPSNRRAYPINEYVNAGAKVKEDLSEAPVILGVKQVPIDSLIPEKTYVFFSHTIKAQDENMELLDAMLEKKVRLIDYEKMVDANGKRMVAFGKYAGVTGMINILHGLGLRLLALGHHTPFMHIGPAHNYRNSSMAQQAIRDAGYEISLGNMPSSIGPLTFVFTGSGNVSQGAQEIFQQLPHEYVKPEHLPKVAAHGATNKVYGCVVDMEDNLIRKSDGGFDAQEYFAHPERYASAFSQKFAPYASVIINGIFWAVGAPRLMTIPDAKHLLQPQNTPWLPHEPGCPVLPHRLLAICDISADPGGSIEFMRECTTINHPFQLYDAEEHVDKEGFKGDGVLVCSIDNMPAQLPREATDFFGSLLMPYIEDMMISDATTPFNQYAANHIVKDAVITSNGKLTPNFEYIEELRQRKRASQAITSFSSDQKVLILGAGYVSAPVVDYLTRGSNTQVTVAAQFREEIDRLARTFPNTVPELLEIHRSNDELEKMIQGHDLVISLLPYSLHPQIAKLCIKHKRNMVTASYRSPAMADLNQAAIDADITVMNEVGVDPGIDHMLAMECFDEVKAHGGKIKSFVSWCGGLPAPEDSATPLRYKFSWSPRGVLLNVLSGAKYLENGKVVEIGAGGSLLDSAFDLDFLPGFNIEGFPNRDSTVYSRLYGIESAQTVIRGTIRYKGFIEVMKGLVQLGLIDETPHALLHMDGPDVTWRQFISSLVGQSSDILIDSLKDLICKKANHDEKFVEAVVELGLLDDKLVDKKQTPLDTLSNYLSKKLDYGPGERDMIIMRHDVGIEWADRSEELKQINLVVYGDTKKYSAMAATVGYPTGIAAKMVLDGEIQERGMLLPFSTNIYRPMLKRLKQEEIVAKETSIITSASEILA
ncbi:hypothetical protein CAPTEDRAFT_173154 [Capitella teleta]|uniref:Uncharacterized protein n=1 Tax=Capitella teleta TaxID=283909 RepID=R7TXE5_CAPTE|nr:hypothetical protein CAPTEDRAFT_173154 [Capitella teleta]|eukprot:ELT95650.1 hypothetical protein CAPTEDRAFT_173154 [Capitella teleta]